jgi:diguanylate cyclase
MFRGFVFWRRDDRVVPPAIADALAITLARRLLAQTRYLYIGLLITVLPAMAGSSADAPYWASTILPLVIGGLLLIGFVSLLPVRVDRIGVRWAKKFIRDATWSSPLVGALCSLWCVVNWLYAPPGMRAYYPLILCMGSLSTAYCLSAIRSAAILNTAIGLIPISALMLFSGAVMDMVGAVCILVAAVFVVQLIFDQHRQWIDLLTLQHDAQVQADTDPLTGLLNRRALGRRMDEQLANPAAQPFVLALLDLDGFKPVNDRHGHCIGDALLCAVAKRLRDTVGPDAAVARMGGDEFAVLLPPQSSFSGDALTAHLLTALVPRFEIEGHDIAIGASAGSASWPCDGIDMRSLIEVADHRLYAVKRGRSAPRQYFEDIGRQAA